jgi:hypothetical protein
MRFLFLLILFFLMALTGSAQGKLTFDSSEVIVRSFNDASIAAYKSEKQFQYDKIGEPVLSLWDRFWIWFWDMMDRMLSTPAGKTTFKTILIVLGIAAVIFFIYKLMGDKTKLFGGKGNKGLPYEIGDEDIHSISFEDAIREAIANENYRLAVRLVYLHSLKLLSDKELIDWKPGKTNTAYVFELKDHPSFTSFNNLTQEFEFAWYGGEEVSKEHYQEIDAAFNDFKLNIKA